MTYTNSPTTAANPSIIPIVLANGTNLDQWPVSRVLTPIQFQRQDGNASAFEQVMEGISTLPQLSSPIIVVPSSSYANAKEQIARNPNTADETIIVEPVDRGNLSALLACAVNAAQSDRFARLLIIDASIMNYDWAAIGRMIKQTQDLSGVFEHIVACGHPAKNDTNPHSLKVMKSGKTDFPHLHQFIENELQTEPSGFAIGMITLATPDVLLKQIEKFQPGMIERCANAMIYGDRLENCIWPSLNHWSILPATQLDDLLNSQSQDCLLRPIELMNPSKQFNSTNEIAVDSVNCSLNANDHMVVVAGCRDLHIVATSDATVIMHKSAANSLSAALSSLQAYEKPELFEAPIRQEVWGIEKFLINEKDYQLLSLTILPGKKLPDHLHHNQHQHWQVLSGTGEAEIGGMSHALSPGLSFEIPANIAHTCYNTGDEPLIITEGRTGMNISQADFSLTAKDVDANSNDNRSKQMPQDFSLAEQAPHRHHNTIQPHVSQLQKTAIFQ